MEMTSTEIIEHLQANQDEEALRELRVLFQTADLVKFARYTALMNENDMNLLNAVDFINHTKQEEVAPEKPEPEVEIVADPKIQRTRRIQLISIVLAGIIILALLAYIGWRVYEVCY
jgi:predicted negative regulator of RcsB-dependent stress response